MNKKTTISLLAWLMALALLAGCGAQRGGGDSGNAEAQAETAEETAPEGTVPEESSPEEAAPEEITMEQLVAANRIAALLDKYGSVLQTIHSGYADTDIFWSIYAEKNLAYIQYVEDPAQAEAYDTVAYLATDAGDAYYYAMEDGLELEVCLYAAPEEEIERIAPEDCEVVDPVMTTRESITGTSEEDGAVRVNTEIDGNTLSYLLDADTLEIRSMEEIQHPSDEDMTIRTEVQRGAARPALLEEMDALLQDALSGEDTRTVTIITDPGQDGESVHSLTLKRGVAVLPVIGENYTLCQQTEAGMTPYDAEDSDARTDLTLYAIADDS